MELATILEEFSIETVLDKLARWSQRSARIKDGSTGRDVDWTVEVHGGNRLGELLTLCLKNDPGTFVRKFCDLSSRFVVFLYRAMHSLFTSTALLFLILDKHAPADILLKPPWFEKYDIHCVEDAASIMQNFLKNISAK